MFWVRLVSYFLWTLQMYINVDTTTPPKIEIVFWKRTGGWKTTLLLEGSAFRGRAIDFGGLLPTPGLWTTSCDECSLGTGPVATALPLDGMASGEIVSSGCVLHDIGERNVTLLGTITYPLRFGYGYVTSLKGKNKASNKIPASLEVCMTFDDANHFHKVPNKELFATNPPGM